MSHHVSNTNVNARSGQYSAPFRVTAVIDAPFRMLTRRSPIAVATNMVWSATLMGLGVMAMKEVKWLHAGDMCDDAPES